METNYFTQLYEINVQDRVDKKNGLDYLAWSVAWAELKSRYPDATYKVFRFGENNLPYVFDPHTGYMVFTSVTVCGVEHEMHLAVTDGANKAMMDVPYTYLTRSGEKTVEAATMHDINTAIMRCLTKNIAMHGLGLHIYNGDEIPQIVRDAEKLQDECVELIKKKATLSDETKSVVEHLCKDADPDANGDPRLMTIDTLKALKKKLLAVRKAPAGNVKE